MLACIKKEQAMSEKKRTSFTSQYKAKVAFEAIRGAKTLNEIAQEFTVHPTQISEWKKELMEQASGIFDIKRGPKAVDPSTSPDRLYSEIGRLKMELDWLKKKSGICL
jgi:transposase-like protein